MTEAQHRRNQIKSYNRRLGEILYYSIGRRKALTVFMNDLKEVYAIPDRYDPAYEKLNADVMELYRVAKVALEEVS